MMELTMYQIGMDSLSEKSDQRPAHLWIAGDGERP